MLKCLPPCPRSSRSRPATHWVHVKSACRTISVRSLFLKEVAYTFSDFVQRGSGVRGRAFEHLGCTFAKIADLRPASTLSFSGYDQIIPAAVAGHGVALGRIPLLKDMLAAKELVAPFKNSADPARAYFAITSRGAAGRPEVTGFIAWLKEEAKA